MSSSAMSLFGSPQRLVDNIADRSNAKGTQCASPETGLVGLKLDHIIEDTQRHELFVRRRYDAVGAPIESVLFHT